MAALRFFARSALSTSRLPLVCCTTWKIPFPNTDQAQKRCLTQRTTANQDQGELPEFEVSTDPKEWAFVERALREQIIPKPPSDAQDLPSGWKPQDPATKNLPYFVERTKNHMQPVYLWIGDRGMRRHTIIKKIQGDIMQLEQEMREYVEKQVGKVVGSQVNEPAGKIKFRGDFVSHCRRFLDSKGF